MIANNTYLAVFTSNKGSAKWRAWYAMGEDERRAKDETGLAALKAWDEAHRDVIVYQGGPLGATKRASETDVGRSHRRWPRALVVRSFDKLRINLRSLWSLLTMSALPLADLKSVRT